MKKIILGIVALIAILWVATFVSDIRILVHEEEPLAEWYEYAKKKNLNPVDWNQVIERTMLKTTAVITLILMMDRLQP